ncbi:hypothetical protein O3Q52_21625 [Streptomyces sp. ActVer]|uniref:hypothetical protein n=1 Tax=Streptomyces sp. ActVer TaxID=3014558 RepID=UPI0022B439CA|nr:hypothetical protein [Streptomyces sp. ActVer]MCZ4510741.1 hypothetical protein [Streptomyces sp. ActVer]
MSEQAELRFLTGTVGVPFVAVVVSRIELVESEERDEVLDHVRRRAQDVHPDVPVLLAPTDARAIGASDPGTLPELLVGVREDASLPLRRSYRFARQMAAVLESMAHVGDERAARDEGLKWERREASASARRQRDSHVLRIQRVQLELERRGVAMAERVVATVRKERGPLANRLELRLVSARNPQDWWESKFFGHLREELDTAATGWVQSLQEGLDSDLHWLEQELSDYVSTRFTGTLPEKPTSSAPSPAVHPPPRLRDLEHWRPIVHLIPQAAQLIDRFLASRTARAQPTGGRLSSDGYNSARSQLVGLAAEAAAKLAQRSLDHQLTEQQHTVASRVRGVVARELDDVAQGLAVAVREVYREARKEVESAGHSWSRAQDQALVDGSGGPLPDWAGLASQARALRAEILART